jgi:hypothetical protein
LGSVNLGRWETLILYAPAAAVVSSEVMLEKDRISYFYDGTFTALPLLLAAKP